MNQKKSKNQLRKAFLKALIAVLFGIFLVWHFCLPATLFHQPTSTVLLDRDGHLLGAQIAGDGQWRFPASDTVPKKFATCILAYEDQDFYAHLGFSPKAMVRAAISNIKSGEVVSGASTITMQVMRMSRAKKSRSITQKLIEFFWATRSEWRYSKEEILGLYTANAPFGGNVVGLEAASWRYFDKSPVHLTWAESAALAVLPNAPGLIYPGRNPAALLRKRNNLLQNLMNRGIIDADAYQLALLEALPGSPLALPDLAYHLLADAKKHHSGKILKTTIDSGLQEQLIRLCEARLKALRANYIGNAAILVTDTPTGEVLSYIGNGSNYAAADGWANNMINTPRSSGSILKPFLYAAMIDAGQLTPKMLVADIPTRYAGFSPKNYDETFTGALPADEALARSLNVPAVRMLQEFGVPQFQQTLHRSAFSTINKSASHYGLSLIIGGAEVNLWEVVQAYRAIGYALLSPIQPDSIPKISYHSADPKSIQQWPLSRGACWAAAEAMALVNRPDDRANWEVFGGSQKVAWKTGTSYGFRDAWAVGITPKYTVGVWVGNASGEGRPGITGLNAAAPLLFDAINTLQTSAWFEPPLEQLASMEICVHSGMRVSANCELSERLFYPKASLETPPCHYCKILHIDRSGKHQVSANCYPVDEMITTSLFELPALQAWFFKQQNPFYQSAPPWLPGCKPAGVNQSIRLIYPQENSAIIIPRELGGIREKAVLKAAHTRADATIYWHLNDRYLGETKGFHHLEIQEGAGNYRLRLIDDTGEEFEMMLEIEERG